MMKQIVQGSLVYRIWAFVCGAYRCSRTCLCVRAFSRRCSESVIAGAFRRFSEKRPVYWDSGYQRVLNRVSAGVSALTVKLNGLIFGLMSGSAVCSAYSGFVGNSGENRLRAIGVFGFYFFLTAAMLGILGVIGRGRSAVSFVLALVFFALAFFAQKLAAAFKDSFFVRLLMGLIR